MHSASGFGTGHIVPRSRTIHPARRIAIRVIGMAGSDHPVIRHLEIRISSGALAQAFLHDRGQGLDGGGGHRTQQFGEVGAALQSTDSLGHPLFEASANTQPHQCPVGAVDMTATGVGACSDTALSSRITSFWSMVMVMRM